MEYLLDIFNNIKINNWNKIDEIITKNLTKINFNIPINNVYFIEMVLINNKYNILKKILSVNIFFDIFDIDNNPILFIPIKYVYIECLQILLNHNNIGISIFDIKNNNGINLILYSLIKNNYDILKIISKTSFSYDVTDSNGNTLYHYIAKYSTLEIAKLFTINKDIINNQNNYGESCLHVAINFNNTEIIKWFLLIINLNIKDYKYELTAIHYAIINNNIKLFDINKINLNIQDYKGRTYIHYLIMYNEITILNKIKKDKIDFNLCDIKGYTPLHLLLLSKQYYNEKNILQKFIEHTNLNLQDNKGNTCMYYLVYNNLWKDYLDILNKKKIDIFIYNLENIQIINIVDSKDYNIFFDLIIHSFYYILQSKNYNYNNFLNYCKTNNSVSKFKKLYPNMYNKIIKNNNITNISNICYELIKFYINENKISIPEKKNKLCIKLEKPTKLSFVPYTGSNIDILCGLYYLEHTFNNVKTSLTSNFINNKDLFNYYSNTGNINYINNNGQDFYNIEIIWDKQKLIFPENSKSLFLNLTKRFLIIPIGIEIQLGNHSNILIYDSKLNIVERFEPNGSTSPAGYYYNSSKLDELIKIELNNYIQNYIYISSKEYLPKVGFQMYENFENQKKKIGDPGGYCSSWSLWYASMVLTYPNIKRKKLILKLIYTIKKNQVSFKDYIRSFTNKIINLRNNIFKNSNIDINDWINNNYTSKNYSIIIANIRKYFNL